MEKKEPKPVSPTNQSTSVEKQRVDSKPIPSNNKIPHANGIAESEKNRPEADAASPSIFDKTFEADSKPKK